MVGAGFLDHRDGKGSRRIGWSLGCLYRSYLGIIRESLNPKP